jgi:hypothetical protein
MTEIVIDTKPYCPDIFFENKSYKVNDVISSKKINSSSTIFIVNLSVDDPALIYNNPEYMLYGNIESLINGGYIANKSEVSGNYFPSLYFFKMTALHNLTTIFESSELSSKYVSLLQNIGYKNIIDNASSFVYKELNVYDSVSKLNRSVIFIFFIYKKFTDDSIENIDFNNFNTVEYYKNTSWNVFIYPFVSGNIPQCCVQDFLFDYNYTFLSTNTIQFFDFDNRENVSFDDKIDFKYFENKNMKKNTSHKSSLLANYSYYMKNNTTFLKEQLESNSILISLNEIGKIYNGDLNSNSNSVSNSINNNYVNKYSSHSSSNNKYLMSFDAKTNYCGELRNKNINEYFMYDYSVGINNSLYEFSRNYQVNGFIDIINKSSKNNTEIFIINQYLKRVYLIINPYIIDSTYFANYVNFAINENSNLMDINNESNCCKGEILLPKNIFFSDTLYLDNYEIIMKFSDYNNYDKIYEFKIILSVAFYNSSNVTIQNLNKTLLSNDLAITSFEKLSENYSMSPCISNYSKYEIYKSIYSENFNDVTNYNFSLNYDEQTLYKFDNNIVSFYNYYFLIPNIDVYFLNIKIAKINNFIKNMINLNNNFDIFYNNSLKNFMLFSIVHDKNINKTLIKNIIIRKENVSDKTNTENEEVITEDDSNVICGEKFKNLIPVPEGKYYIFKYSNLFPVERIVGQSLENDDYVKSINTTKKFADNEFSLFIKIPEKYEISSFKTKIYLVANFYEINSDGTTNPISEPYLYNNEFYLGFELFNFYYYNSTNINLKYFLNMFAHNYMNFNTLNIIIPFHKYYNEKNSFVIDNDNTIIKLHNDVYINKIIEYDDKRFSGKSSTSTTFKIQFSNGDYTFSNENISVTGYNVNYINKGSIFYKTEIELANSFYNMLIERHELKVNYNRLLFILNTNKIQSLLKKCKCYLNLIKFSIMLGKSDNSEYYDYIKNNIKTIMNYTTFNYNLNITHCVTSEYILNLLNEIYLVSNKTTLENINLFSEQTQFIIIYESDKFNLVLNEINDYQNNKKYNSGSDSFYDTTYHKNIKNFIEKTIKSISKNKYFYSEYENEITSFVDNISDSDIQNLGFIDIANNGLHNTDNFFKNDGSINSYEYNNAFECNDLYVLYIKQYLKNYFCVIYLYESSIEESHNFVKSKNNINKIINQFIECLTRFIENNSENIAINNIEELIGHLKELLLSYTALEELISNIDETGETYDIDTTSLENSILLLKQATLIKKTLSIISNFLKLAEDTLQNNSFNCFYGYISYFNTSVTEYATMGKIKKEIVNNYYSETDNKLIKIIQLYDSGFITVTLLFNMLNKVTHVYIKNDKITSIKETVPTVIAELSEQNELFSDFFTLLSTGLNTKISYFETLIDAIESDSINNVIGITNINKNSCTTDVLNMNNNIIKLVNIIDSVDEEYAYIYKNLIKKNTNISSILNYNYISNAYKKINIGNILIAV